MHMKVGNEDIADVEVERIEETHEQLAERETAEAAAAAEKDKPVVIDAAEHKRVQKELKDARSQLREERQMVKFYADQAEREGKQPKAAAEKVDDFADIDLVNEITTNGFNGLKKIFDRAGYVTEKDVEKRINAARAEITEQAQLISQYPDLNDPGSDFFKATAAIYKSLKDDMPASKAIAAAARIAKAEMGAPTRRRVASPDLDLDDDEGDDDQPDERSQRVARQAGDRGSREQRRTAPVLSAEEKAMVANFARAGADITEESYLKAALKGVNLGGIPQQQRRGR